MGTERILGRGHHSRILASGGLPSSLARMGRAPFLIDDGVVFLNHGSFGACPEPVFAEYQDWQRQLEREPVDFLARRLPALLEDVREQLGAFVGADPEELALLPNATAGVNVVARSLELRPGDEVLSTDHEYGAMRFVWQDACARAGAAWVERPVAAPARDIVEEVWSGVTPRTRVLFVSHITSPTAIRFPVEELCRRAREAGILSVVDGAHGPGQLDLDLEELGADVYAGNCHKWLCAPKASGFLWARPELRDLLRPHATSWGARSDRFARAPRLVGHGRSLGVPRFAGGDHVPPRAPRAGAGPVPCAACRVPPAPGHAGGRVVRADGERRATALRCRRSAAPPLAGRSYRGRRRAVERPAAAARLRADL